MAVAETPLVLRCLSEFIGAFLPFIVVGFNVIGGNATYSGVSLATVLTVLTYALAGVSGANFNPAVTAALYMSKRLGGPGLDPHIAGIYVVVQLVAGVCCGLCFVNLFWDSFRLGPGAGFSWTDALMCEFLYSGLLCFVVLNTTAARKYNVEGNHFFGLAIGAMYLAGSYAAAPVSGGLLSPAITIGTDFAGAGRGFGKCFIYSIFQFLGAIVAAYLYKMVRPEDFEEQCTPRTRLISEMIGTFALVLTVGLAVLANTPLALLSIAGCLMSMVYAVGDVSGGHFNPAVTMAVVVSGSDSEFIPKRAAVYVLGQCLAAAVAGLTFCLIHNGNSFSLGPGTGYSVSAAVAAETLFTGLLAYVVVSTAVLPRTKTSQLFGLSIGLCIVVGGCAAGKISGASLNPAVSVGIAASNGGLQSLKTALRYSFFELAGGILAGALVRLTHTTSLAHAPGESSKLLFSGA